MRIYLLNARDNEDDPVNWAKTWLSIPIIVFLKKGNNMKLQRGDLVEVISNNQGMKGFRGIVINPGNTHSSIGSVTVDFSGYNPSMKSYTIGQQHLKLVPTSTKDIERKREELFSEIKIYDLQLDFMKKYNLDIFDIEKYEAYQKMEKIKKAKSDSDIVDILLSKE